MHHLGGEMFAYNLLETMLCVASFPHSLVESQLPQITTFSPSEWIVLASSPKGIQRLLHGFGN